MKVDAQLYGKEIGTENNITRSFIDREWQILLTFRTDDNRCQHRMIVSCDEAKKLIHQLQECFELGKQHQFSIV